FDDRGRAPRRHGVLGARFGAGPDGGGGVCDGGGGICAPLDGGASSGAELTSPSGSSVGYSGIDFSSGARGGWLPICSGTSSIVTVRSPISLTRAFSLPRQSK